LARVNRNFHCTFAFCWSQKLPELAKSLSKAIREFARTKEEVKRTLSKQLSIDDDTYLEVKEEDEEEDENKKEKK